MDRNRERFETWLRSTRGYKVCATRGKPMSLRTNVPGDYLDYRVNDRWYAWNAALAGTPEAPTLAAAARELADAADGLYDCANGFNVSGVYFNEWVDNERALRRVDQSVIAVRKITEETSQ